MKFQALAHHEQALHLRALRNGMLSSNIANADTPDYKARDIDFAQALKSAKGEGISLHRTSSLHQQSTRSGAPSPREMYRVPMQPTLDGNTVETDVEQAQFAENALQYRATLAFLDGQIRGLRFAIRGGD